MRSPLIWQFITSINLEMKRGDDITFGCYISYLRTLETIGMGTGYFIIL